MNLLMQHICIWLWGYYFPKKLYGDDGAVYTREKSWYRLINVRTYICEYKNVKTTSVIKLENFKYHRIYWDGSTANLQVVKL